MILSIFEPSIHSFLANQDFGWFIMNLVLLGLAIPCHELYASSLALDEHTF